MNSAVRQVDLTAFDLDGTLLSANGTLDLPERRGLELLGRGGMVRVVATGRSLMALRKVLPLGAPVDYAIFSSGNGVLHWPTGRIMLRRRLSAARVLGIAELLVRRGLSFMAQALIPDNHRMLYWRADNASETDFEQRVAYHRAVAQPVQSFGQLGRVGVSQFVVPMPPGTSMHRGLAQELRGYADVVCATSPFDGQSVWFEVFPRGVSKGCTLQWLCRKLGIAQERVAAVGNDYNDVSMLEIARYPFVVGNAPLGLLERFPVLPPNADHGCCQMMQWAAAAGA